MGCVTTRRTMAASTSIKPQAKRLTWEELRPEVTDELLADITRRIVEKFHPHKVIRIIRVGKTARVQRRRPSGRHGFQRTHGPADGRCRRRGGGPISPHGYPGVHTC